MEFSIQAILSLTTGKTFQNGVTEMKQMMAYMLDRDVDTTQLVRGDAVEKCKQSLLQQYPEFANFDTSGMNPDNYQEYVDKAILKFGKHLTIKPLWS